MITQQLGLGEGRDNPSVPDVQAAGDSVLRVQRRAKCGWLPKSMRPYLSSTGVPAPSNQESLVPPFTVTGQAGSSVSSRRG